MAKRQMSKSLAKSPFSENVDRAFKPITAIGNPPSQIAGQEETEDPNFLNTTPSNAAGPSRITGRRLTASGSRQQSKDVTTTASDSSNSYAAEKKHQADVAEKRWVNAETKVRDLVQMTRASSFKFTATPARELPSRKRGASALDEDEENGLDVEAIISQQEILDKE
ncbi:uncharacterized protein KY384_002843 [Bacidia gigantensis]|uniref:uncharacterized protein n=1 Tax=Bacidia gigantensis TaxID=2732470 RepID=UPI001D0595F6|nr:uncharacterized protein KY384_002843 [Bacidia gigantensis]KAG8532358.1 hypothetical protein KY384_002843 [Bacidia gigantensis]